jgi:hypothetical protein
MESIATVQPYPLPNGRDADRIRAGIVRERWEISTVRASTVAVGTVFWILFTPSQFERYMAMLRSKGKNYRRPTAKRGSSFKPFLEVLEDRFLLSVGATLQGTVVDDSNNHAPLAGAIVTLTQPGNNSFTPQTVTTGADGSYSFTVAPGTYQLAETPPSGYKNDSTEIIASPVETASQIDSATIQVMVPQTVQLSVPGSQFGTTAPTEVLSYNINGASMLTYAGQYSATINGNTFNTYCVDLGPGDQLTLGSNVYTVQPQTDLTGIGGSNVQVGHSGEIAYLYDNFGTSTFTGPNADIDAAAFQVAIWSLEYNADPSVLDSTTQTIPAGNHFYLTGPNQYTDQNTYNAVVAQAETYVNDATGNSGQALFLAPTGSVASGAPQGMIAPPGSYNFSDVPKASPTISTTPNASSITLTTSSETLTDTAVLSGGTNPTGSITFTLYYNSTLVDTETVSVSGDGTYTTPTGYTLPTNKTVTGTYQWDATYSGDSNNNGVSEINNANEQTTVSPATPTISTTPNSTNVTLTSQGFTLKDTATVSGSYSGTGSITFTLYYNGTKVDTETVSVSGDGKYTTPTGYTLPSTGTVTGTYQWDATYTGDGNNNGAIDNNNPNEQVTIKPVSPGVGIFFTKPNPTSVTLSNTSVVLTDTATLGGDFHPTGTITFTLYDPNGHLVDTETVTVSHGNGDYTTPTGYTLASNALTGTYQWDASYSGDGNNSGASDINNPNEQVVVTASTPVGKGEFATIGFWRNKNGQAVIDSFNGGSTATQLGNWLATTFPNLFGTSNPYTGTSLAGLTNAQIYTVYSNLSTAGVQANTYIQAFAVALGIYADTTSLGGQSLINNGLAAKYGFKVTSAGGGNATFNIGNNGAAFGVSNGTSLTVFQILAIANANFNPATGLFFGGDPTLTGDLNNVLNGINTKGDIS